MVKTLQAKLAKAKARKGFTLVELIVVIAIIAVLAAILIPTLSGVIESSRKRSAESTCQSIQTAAKAFAQTVTAKTGLDCTPTTTTDMDDGNGQQTMQAYILSQVPEIGSSTTKGASVRIVDGKINAVYYTEGAYTAGWTEAGGNIEAEKGSANAAAAGGVSVT